jgi:hypothetical protein
MEKLELKDFYNDGFGWICKHCEHELKTEANISDKKISRLMTEGEAESKQPKLSNVAMAKWADAERQTLICPRCAISESVGKL